MPKSRQRVELSEGEDLYIRKSVILRFVLDTLESGSSKQLVKRQSNNDAHGYVIFIAI